MGPLYGSHVANMLKSFTPEKRFEEYVLKNKLVHLIHIFYNFLFRLAFWVDTDETRTPYSVIMNGSMAGGPVTALTPEVFTVTSMTYDPIKDRLFWYDSYFGNVMSIESQGKNAKVSCLDGKRLKAVIVVKVFFYI